MRAELRRLAAGLTRAQHDAVFSDAARVCIVAGAGSGKTLVLTRRIARTLAEDPAAAAHAVAVTFTRKAAGELTDRLDALGLTAEIRCGTFHALAYRAITEYRRLHDLPERRVVEHKAALVSELMRAHGRDADRRLVRAVASEIEHARARVVGPDDFAAHAEGRRLPLPAADIAGIYAAYADLKARRGVLDFEDLLEGWAHILETQPAYSRAPVRRVDHVFVDEFQDVSPAQFRLLSALVDGARGRETATLCAVGDDDQSIYGFGGAEAGYLLEFERLWPGADVIHLEDNFRCPPQVLRVANAVLSEGRGRRGKVLRPNVADGPLPEVASHADELVEAAWVARSLARTRRPGGTWRSCAVLARTNRQLEPIRHALTAAGIPTVVRAGTALAASQQVRDVLDRLRTGERHGTLAPGMPFAALVAELAGTDLSAAVLTGDESGTGPEPAVDPDLDALVAAAAEYELATLDAGASTSADGLTAWLRTTVGAEGGHAGADAVSLLSMHRAKGLEFDVVFVVGLEEGFAPIVHAADDAAVEEERRLFYVALTRSRRRLLLSWCRTRTLRDSTRQRARSRFLDPVVAALQHAAAETAPAPGWRTWLGGMRAGAGHRDTDSGPDPTTVLDDLRAWRSRTAAREGVAAHLVAHDATLRHLASNRPVDLTTLARTPDLDQIKLRRYGPELLDLLRGSDTLTATSRA